MSKLASNLSRRDLLKFGGLSAVGALGMSALAGCSPKVVAPEGGVPKAGSTAATTGSADGVPSFLLTPEPVTDFAETHEYDVVVVGAGESGLAAIHAARAAGASVGVLQSLPIVQTAGNMGASIDLTQTSEAGIKAAVSFISYKSDYRSSAEQVEAWARNSQEALAWWEEAAAAGGSVFQPYDYVVNCNGHDVYFHANTYFHDEGHQKGALVIGDAVQAEGAEIFFETPCVQLLKEGDRVVGAIGKRKSDDKHVLLKAKKGVIMAAGDYVGDTEMLHYFTPDAKGLHQAVDFRNGTGLKAALWAGAQMCPASHTKMVHGEGPKVRFEMPYLFLDRHGKRFMDEGCCRMGYLNEFTNKYLAEVDFAEDTAVKFFSIVPTNWQERYDAWKSFSDISNHNAYRNVDPEAWVKGETLEELAANMIAYADDQKWAHDYTVEAVSSLSTLRVVLCFSSAYVLGGFLAFLGNGMAPLQLAVLLTALPLTACACVRAAFRSIPEAALPHRLFPRFSYPWKLYVLMALYSFAYGLRQMQMVDGTGRGSTSATMIASAVVFASAWFFADRVVLIKASRAPMLFMVCGFLLVPAQSVMGDAVSSYLISISYTLMHVFTLVLLCSMARKSGVPAPVLVAPLYAVQLLTMVGVGVDAGLGALGMSAVAQSTVSVVMVALLVALITLLLLSERRWDSHWTVVLDDDSLAEESSREGAVAARCDELSARCGLSPREDEIMRLLARKKTMAAIARDLYIAEGTVKAHVRHIYEKAGINTRKDLLELLGVGDR